MGYDGSKASSHWCRVPYLRQEQRRPTRSRIWRNGALRLVPRHELGAWESGLRRGQQEHTLVQRRVQGHLPRAVLPRPCDPQRDQVPLTPVASGQGSWVRQAQGPSASAGSSPSQRAREPIISSKNRAESSVLTAPSLGFHWEPSVLTGSACALVSLSHRGLAGAAGEP